jgi:uncharacterized protein YjbI with pentapeptide repeats
VTRNLRRRPQDRGNGERRAWPWRRTIGILCLVGIGVGIFLIVSGLTTNGGWTLVAVGLGGLVPVILDWLGEVRLKYIQNNISAANTLVLQATESTRTAIRDLDELTAKFNELQTQIEQADARITDRATWASTAITDAADKAVKDIEESAGSAARRTRAATNKLANEIRHQIEVLNAAQLGAIDRIVIRSSTDLAQRIDEAARNLRDSGLKAMLAANPDTKGADLTGTLFPSVRLADADLSRARLNNAIWENCELSNVRFTKAKMGGAHLSGSFSFCTFDHADLYTAGESRTTIRGHVNGCSFNSATLRDVDFTHDLSTSDQFTGNTLSYSDLRGASFDGLQLNRVCFYASILGSLRSADETVLLIAGPCDFRRAHLTNLTIVVADGVDVNDLVVSFDRAVLEEVVFHTPIPGSWSFLGSAARKTQWPPEFTPRMHGVAAGAWRVGWRRLLRKLRPPAPATHRACPAARK